MYAGKTLFAQIMDFLPWTSFQRIVQRYRGDHRARTLTCAEQFRVMAFAQLTYRESLRDIETCLAAQASKLYHMGFREPVRRATLADANEARDWRIYAEFAQRLIARARRLYAQDSFGVELDHTVYALDATTIDLCLSMFPWAFRSTKAAVKLHTLLDLRGAIPSFIHISDGKLHDVNVLDLLLPEPGAFYIMDRGYLDFARLYGLDQAGSFFVTRAKRNMNARRLYSAAVDRETGLICDQTIALNNFYAARAHHLRALQESLAGGAVLQVGEAAPGHQAFLRHLRQRSEDPGLDRRIGLCARRDHQEGTAIGRIVAYVATDPVGHAVRENAVATSPCRFCRPRFQPRRG